MAAKALSMVAAAAGICALAACAGLPGTGPRGELAASRDAAVFTEPQPTWQARPAPPPRRATASTVEGAVAYGVPPEEAVAAINALREAAGVPPVTLDPQLSAAALAHVQDLARREEISALTEGGLGVIGRLRRAGVTPYAASSLVAGGYPTVDEAAEVWAADPIERARLLLPEARSVGIARVEAPGTAYRWYVEVILADL